MFRDRELEIFLEESGIEQHKITLLWPQEKGEVEGQNK
jgi:hypothetical protein